MTTYYEEEEKKFPTSWGYENISLLKVNIYDALVVVIDVYTHRVEIEERDVRAPVVYCNTRQYLTHFW